MHPRENHVKVLLLCSSFNGLSQRTWSELRGAGHDVRVQLADDPEAAIGAAAALEPDVILCPFIKERVPAEIWQRYRTIIIHPGPPGEVKTTLRTSPRSSSPTRSPIPGSSETPQNCTAPLTAWIDFVPQAMTR